MSEDIRWKARTFVDKVLKKAVQEEIEKLALVVLGNNKLQIKHNKEGFDKYPSCKHWAKQYCPVGNKKLTYMGRWCEYVVFGTSRTDIYLEVLRLLANNNSVYFPIVSFRHDDDWVEREKVVAYKDKE